MPSHKLNILTGEYILQYPWKRRKEKTMNKKPQIEKFASFSYIKHILHSKHSVKNAFNLYHKFILTRYRSSNFNPQFDCN